MGVMGLEGEREIYSRLWVYIEIDWGLGFYKEILFLERVILGVTNLEGDRDIFEIMGLDRERLGVRCLKREREGLVN